MEGGVRESGWVGGGMYREKVVPVKETGRERERERKGEGNI